MRRSKLGAAFCLAAFCLLSLKGNQKKPASPVASFLHPPQKPATLTENRQQLGDLGIPKPPSGNPLRENRNLSTLHDPKKAASSSSWESHGSRHKLYWGAGKPVCVDSNRRSRNRPKRDIDQVGLFKSYCSKPLENATRSKTVRHPRSMRLPPCWSPHRLGDLLPQRPLRRFNDWAAATAHCNGKPSKWPSPIRN